MVAAGAGIDHSAFFYLFNTLFFCFLLSSKKAENVDENTQTINLSSFVLCIDPPLTIFDQWTYM